jgi:hypothetical protein
MEGKRETWSPAMDQVVDRGQKLTFCFCPSPPLSCLPGPQKVLLLCKLHAILMALTRLSKLLASLWGREWPCRLLWQMWGVSPLHSLHPGLSLCSFTDHTLQNLVHCPTRPLRGPPLSSALRVMLHSLILRSQAHLSESFADSSYKVRCVPMLLCSFSYLSPWICFLLCWVSPSLDWKLLKGECPVHFHYYCHLGTQTPGSVIQ